MELLSPEHAVLDQRGRLLASAYVPLVEHFSGERGPRSAEPRPSAPGLRHEAPEELGQLRCWEDAKGAGWIASDGKQSAWFSLASWKTWRLAFLLAKLQRDVWRGARRDGQVGRHQSIHSFCFESYRQAAPKREAKRGRPKSEEAAI